MSGGGVKALAHRHIAHSVGRKKALVVVDRTDLIPPQPGEVLCDHQIDALFPDVPQQALEGGAVEVRAGVSVVRIDSGHRPALLPDILQQKGLLVGDTHGLVALPLVLPGEAEVQPYLGKGHGGSSFPARSSSSRHCMRSGPSRA